MESSFRGSGEYVASEELLQVTNIAIALQKPLLIKGEPGTGKTVLAQAVAESLQKRLLIWNIKSTTKAQEGLYIYDVVQRLYDSQLGLAGVDQAVLLIDEIDKADLEFPNDLLWELDRMEFYIPETGRTVRAKQRPIVIITSNAEKELPDAFLRRCIFHYITFPDEQLMAEIIRVHEPDLEDSLLRQALETFYWVRSIHGLQKKPSTSELLDWIQALQLGGIASERILQELPFAGVLLKKNEDLELLNRQRK